MTETEWLACTNPKPMLAYIRGKATERKLRLFDVACCRRIWHLIQDEDSRKAIDVFEKYADGKADEVELDEARENSYDAHGAAHRAATAAGWSASAWVTNAAANAASCVTFHSQDWLSDTSFFETAIWAARASAGPQVEGIWSDSAHPDRLAAEYQEQSGLLRHIFNSFHLLLIEPLWLSWNDATVVSIAHRIYDGRRFSDLPILGDALQDAGCDQADILNHCRQPGEHVRGCWLVDLLLDKS